uniref:Uncharacterized protein n=1 Tax=Ditylenchus dipsaci TaxID=166011 RepID=A0A915D820_9BILA
MLLSLGNLMMRMILMVNSMREHFPLLQEKFYLHVAINAICVVGCLLNIGYYVRFGPRVYYAIVTVFLPMLCASVAMYESLTIAYCYGSKKCSLTFKQCFLKRVGGWYRSQDSTNWPLATASLLQWLHDDLLGLLDSWLYYCLHPCDYRCCCSQNGRKFSFYE